MKFIEVKESEQIKEFLKISKKLYLRNERTDDKDTIIKLIKNKHPLSKYFEFKAFIVYQKGVVVSRFGLTRYPEDENLYFGFFECVKSKDISKKVFMFIENYARKINAKKIIGPVDASFWIKYRMKINLFENKYYTGEPYNKDYYYKMCLKNGFKIMKHYTSNGYNIVGDYQNEKFKVIYDSFIENGYIIESPKKKDFKKVIEDIYYLITTLYKDFPIYKDLTYKDFYKIFKSYKTILDFDMVKIAYFENTPVGFFISVPNYSNIVYNLNLINIFKLFKERKNPKEYVMLYMGILPKHKGLGSALSNSIMEELRKKNVPSIGALAMDGKVTQKYASDMIKEKYEYVLLEKEVKYDIKSVNR